MSSNTGELGNELDHLFLFYHRENKQELQAKLTPKSPSSTLQVQFNKRGSICRTCHQPRFLLRLI